MLGKVVFKFRDGKWEGNGTHRYKNTKYTHTQTFAAGILCNNNALVMDTLPFWKWWLYMFLILHVLVHSEHFPDLADMTPSPQL